MESFLSSHKTKAEIIDTAGGYEEQDLRHISLVVRNVKSHSEMTLQTTICTEAVATTHKKHCQQGLLPRDSFILDPGHLGIDLHSQGFLPENSLYNSLYLTFTDFLTHTRPFLRCVHPHCYALDLFNKHRPSLKTLPRLFSRTYNAARP